MAPVRAREPGQLTSAELVVTILAGALALLVVTAYLVDAAGGPLDPALMLLLFIVEVSLVFLWLRRSQNPLHLDHDLLSIAGFATAVLGTLLYLLWLAWPTFLPLTYSGDTVLHARLAEFIYFHHSLGRTPQDLHQLSELMMNYPPGAHILAALLAAWSGTVPLRLLQPLLALLVALKAGTIYNLICRLLPRSRRNPWVAVAGTVLLFLAYGYFLESFTAWYFYSQVASELFVLFMLWQLLVWDEHPALARTGLFGLSAAAGFLIWPTWIPIVVLSFLLLLLLRRDLDRLARFCTGAIVILPITLTALLYLRGGLLDFHIAATENGSALPPSLDALGRPLLVAALLGLVVSLRHRRTLALLLFTGAALLQTIMLGLGMLLNWNDSYALYKMFYLLVYPIILFAALGLAAGWEWLGRFWRPSWPARWSSLSLVLPLLVLFLAVRRDLPIRMSSAIHEPLYDAGLWAKSHLPNDCVDYMVGHWVTAFWLHVNLLGNPLESPRIASIVDHFDVYDGSVGRSSEPGLAYAIVENWQAVPDSTRAGLVLLHQVGRSAVVQRQAASTCPVSPTPVDGYANPPRRGTLFGLFGLLHSSP